MKECKNKKSRNLNIILAIVMVILAVLIFLGALFGFDIKNILAAKNEKKSEKDNKYNVSDLGDIENMDELLNKGTAENKESLDSKENANNTESITSNEAEDSKNKDNSENQEENEEDLESKENLKDVDKYQNHFYIDKKEGEGTLAIKVKSKRKPLSAQYEIYDKDGIAIFQLGTDEDGKTGVKGIGKGTYYFKQIKLEDGYVKDDTVYRFTVDDFNKTFYKTITTEQEKLGKSIIVLKDDNGNPIQGAKFDFYAEGEKEKILTVKTNKEGLAGTINLVASKYYYVQVSAPEGYEFSTEKYEFESTIEGEIKRFDIINHKK